jgi:thiamine biosynthesis protein ThiS
MTIEIRLNGERKQIPAGLNLPGLLRHLDIHADRVAVELDRVIVRKPEWDATQIEPGAEVEVVHFVGGGSR